MALIKVTAAARELGISVQSFRKKLRTGEWPSYVFGPRSTMIDLAEIKSLVKERGQTRSADEEGPCAA